MLALFPGLLALVALLGLLGQYPDTYNAIIRIVDDVAPRSTVNAISSPLRGVIKSSGGAGALFGIGLIGTLWAASGYVGAFSWATNIIWGAERGRSWYRQGPINLAVTLVGLLIATLVLIAFVVSGSVADAVGRQLGIASTAVTIWNIAKWPVVVALIAVLVGGLFYIAPNVRQPPPRWLTPGAVFAIVAWILGSFLFSLYVANFSSYNATYGSLGAVITFLVWVWATNTAILLGVELDTEIERERQLAAGLPAKERLHLKLRQT